MSTGGTFPLALTACLLRLGVASAAAFGNPLSSQFPKPELKTGEARTTFMQEIAHSTDRAVATLFEWEHERAAAFERFGKHEYWADPRIHNFGNQGWRGLLHALVVPFATHAIDRFAYDGVDARKVIHETEFPEGAEVVDLCCGVGFSPARNCHVTAVDTSEEMLTVAKLRRPDVQRFEVGNAETWGEVRFACQATSRLPHTCLAPAASLVLDHACRLLEAAHGSSTRAHRSLRALVHALGRTQEDSCDIATVMFGMHEMPGDARRRVLRNALRISRGTVLVVDIWPGFKPTPMMLSGEPFVLEYLAHIDDDVDATLDDMQWTVTRVDVVPKHVRMWRFEKLDWGI